MRTLFLAACLLGLCTPGFAGTALKPERATYTVLRDGKTIGTATYALAHNPDGGWTLKSETRGTNGMARLLGLDVREESTFVLRDGKIEGSHYAYEQNAVIKHKRRTIDFDASARRARVRDNGKSFDYAIPPGAIDRSTVAVALGLALADGAKTMEFPVATKDHVERQRFSVRATEEIRVPAGDFRAARVERTDVPGKARSWYAPGASVLPLRVEQKQHDGSTIVMELSSR
jgi:hypothetical protein